MKPATTTYEDQAIRENYYSYPAHKVLGVFDTPESVKETFDELTKSGFNESDVQVYCSAGQIDFSGEEEKLWGRIVHSREHLGLAGEFLERFADDLSESHLILSVSAKDRAAKDDARRVMQSHEGHRLTFFGNWIVEEMPEANNLDVTRQPYGFRRSLEVPFEEALSRTRDALNAEGFGVLTEIDMQEKLKKKLGEEFREYAILGACNPSLAFSALQHDLDIGLLLPCNVVVYEEGEGSVVAAINAEKMLSITDSSELDATARSVGESLQRAISSI